MVFFVWALLEALLVNTGGSPAARVLASVGYSAPLLWRRQAPLATLGAIGSIAAARAFSTHVADQGAMPFPALLVGTFSVGLYVRRLPVSLLGAVFPVALLLALSRSPMWRHERQVQDYAILTFFVSAAWLSGYLIRRRAAQVNAAESAAGERARAAVTSERARIARELHDIVAHSVSIIALQAGAAEALVERDPEAARDHIASVRGIAHDALGEMRRLLDVLREDEPAYAPTPDLGDVDELIAASCEAGVPVELDRDGDLADVPPGVALTVYRIVQESLTNVRKHAGAAPTRVVIRRDRDGLELLVENQTGSRPATPGNGGHGLLGMRERARMYGGTLDARATESGGFRIHASIPLARSDT